MKVRLRGIFLMVVLLLASGTAAGYVWLQRSVSSAAFRTEAQSRLEKILHAEISLGTIRYRFPNRIVLSGLELIPREDDGAERLVIGQVIFAYGFDQLLSGNWRLPSAIIFEAPTMVLGQGSAIPSLFSQEGVDSSGSMMSDLRLSGGQIRYRLPAIDSDLQLENVQGTFLPHADGTIRVKMTAGATGVIRGKLDLEGQVQADAKTFDLVIRMQGVDFDKNFPVPLRHVTGTLRADSSGVRIETLKSEYRGWTVSADGILKGLFSDLTRVKLDVSARKTELLYELSLDADLTEQMLTGFMTLPWEKRFDFRGRVSREETKFLFDDLALGPDLYEGRGCLDFITGDYEVYLQNQHQRFSVRSSLKKADWRIGFHFDHLQILGLDLVTAGRLRVIPSVSKWDDEPWQFTGDFNTDYFILGQEPFSDFQGNFEFAPSGFPHFEAKWGKVFHLAGNIERHAERSDADMLLRVNGFDLALVRDFAEKPLPKDLRGILEGKLKMQGDLRHLDVIGHFGVKNGAIGKLEYDRGIVKFRGFPPYFPLEDSRIFKGRTTLYLTGALDLSLKNPFYGVFIKTPDKFVVWKGMTMNVSSREKDLEFVTGISKVPPLRIGGDRANGQTNGRDNFQEGGYGASVGPKIKF